MALTAGGKLVSGLTLEDPADGVRKSYVVQLTSQLAAVNAANTATTLAVSAATVQVGTAVTFTSTVKATPVGATQPTGTVTFKNGAATLGTAPLNGTGVATLTLTLPAANYSVTANYTATDSDYFKNSKSPNLAVDVQALPTVQFLAKSVNVKDTAGSVTLKVQRVGSTLGAVAVGYATANGTATDGIDYVAKSGSLNWAAGDAADKTVTITVLTRRGNQPNRVFNVTLSAPGGATLGATPTEAVTVQK